AHDQRRLPLRDAARAARSGAWPRPRPAADRRRRTGRHDRGRALRVPERGRAPALHGTGSGHPAAPLGRALMNLSTCPARSATGALVVAAVVVAAGMAAAATAHAQSLQHDTSLPIEITADSLEVLQNEQ